MQDELFKKRNSYQTSCEKKEEPHELGQKWCPGGDSNPHAFRHQILNLARLPIPPPGPEFGKMH